ncbi:MAG: alkaline phosphatase family protein [Deltaproteobacteria bacterium]|nr:alkaline phosphatase family protein [Nannocystaceae bacterium]
MVRRTTHPGLLSRRRILQALAALPLGCGARIDTPPGEQDVGWRALEPTQTLTRIAFGSCCDQRRSQPIWRTINARNPELFLFIGDNVYADAEHESRLQAAYDELGGSDGFNALRRNTPVMAVWDDHDFGRNDAGSEYPLREASQRIMLDFFGEPAESVRRTRPGIYDAKIIGPVGRRVQIILLDCRYFRDPLLPGGAGPSRFRPNDDPAATVLGAAQWDWLEQVVREPAELRLMVSSFQLVSAEHPFESWGLFPRERDRLFDLISRTAGVIVLSGDRHRGELSRIDQPPLSYPLSELTSSSLNLPLPGSEPNRWRIGAQVEDANFGWIEIDWSRERVQLALLTDTGRVALEERVELAALAV